MVYFYKRHPMVVDGRYLRVLVTQQSDVTKKTIFRRKFKRFSNLQCRNFQKPSLSSVGFAWKLSHLCTVYPMK